MKHNYNLLLVISFLLFVVNCKADQLTITFTNPVPAAPVNCSDAWTEQGLEMEVTPLGNYYCAFNYGNGNIYFAEVAFKIDLTSFGLINKITVSYQYPYFINFNYYNSNVLLFSETPNHNSNTFVIHEYNNTTNEIIEYLEIVSSEPGPKLFDITIDYTPICESKPISNVRNGDAYLNDACYGVIMTSPSGNCFRAKVADNGMLFTELVECP